ncbi:MAG: nucleoside deaminase [Proteobacteria bacterium]|nr:nucleoside deaminase [Pseudomonadota bacterium]
MRNVNGGFFLNLALNEAKAAFLKGEVPVGAVIVKDNNVIATAHNLVETNTCALHHAEIVCLEKAFQKLSAPFLNECDLYVTLEPCAMCAGAIALARIRRVYFGAYDPKGGFVEHQARIFKYTLHKPEVYGGILEEECAKLLTTFFKNKR